MNYMTNRHLLTRLPYYSESGLKLEYGTEGSAGLDLPIWDERLNDGTYSTDGTMTLQPNQAVKLKTGMYIAIPEGQYGELDTRSSTSDYKLDLLCRTIDRDFRGNIRLSMINLNEEPVTVRNGQFPAQIIIQPYTRCLSSIQNHDAFFDVYGNTERGDKGFGSTGRNE